MQKLFFILLFISSFSYAQTNIAPVSLENQHGKVQAINQQSKLVIFTHDMDGKDIVNEALNSQDKGFLEQYAAVCVADVERMPAIIARLFAYPAMRDYSYNIMLDKTGKNTADWPRKEEAVTLMYLNKGKMTKHQFYSDAKKLLQAIKDSKAD